MIVPMPRPVRAFALGIAVLGLSACQQQETANEAEAAQDAAPDAKPGLAVEGATLVLPAVSGNPGVAYFAISNAADAPVSLVSVYIEGAEKTELHETVNGQMGKIDDVAIAPGETVTFERGGKHVMVFGITDVLQAGGTSELTLTFSDGDKLSTPVAINDASSVMSDMDHGAAH
jgi:hypothetical protein